MSYFDLKIVIETENRGHFLIQPKQYTFKQQKTSKTILTKQNEPKIPI